MSDNKLENRLLGYVDDNSLIDYYYLNYNVDDLIDKLHNLTFTLINDKSVVPFNAQLRDYTAAIDSDNHKWLVKKVNQDELFEHKLFELAYYLDFMLQTLAVPSVLTKINGEFYRASKLVLNSIQISSYNYLEEPFKKVLTNDLINRWLFYDEDRNPNNYMIVHNSKRQPLIVVIDYNKVDLTTPTMKITGKDEKFGWDRKEKTRFLTLLKPSNFEDLPIENFDHRLKLLMSLNAEKLKAICKRLFKEVLDDYDKKAEEITSNILKRRDYINDYFRKSFKQQKDMGDIDKDDQYSGFGKSFMNYYKKKK